MADTTGSPTGTNRRKRIAKTQENDITPPAPQIEILRDDKGRILPGQGAKLVALRDHSRPAARRHDLMKLTNEEITEEDLRVGLRSLAGKFRKGEYKAVELVFAYLIGTPVQRSVRATGELKDLLLSWRAPGDVQEPHDDDGLDIIDGEVVDTT